MRLKIVEQGWETFSGTLGVVQFKDGVSVDDVSRVEANVISGNIRVVDVESGDNVGALGLCADTQNTPCFSVTLKTMDQVFAERDAGIDPDAKVVATEVKSDETTYTKEALEAIADKSGIAGLRAVGDVVGVKGTSIAGLIEAILQKQSPQEPEAAPLEQGTQETAVVKDQAE